MFFTAYNYTHSMLKTSNVNIPKRRLAYVQLVCVNIQKSNVIHSRYTVAHILQWQYPSGWYTVLNTGVCNTFLIYRQHVISIPRSIPCPPQGV